MTGGGDEASMGPSAVADGEPHIKVVSSSRSFCFNGAVGGSRRRAAAGAASVISASVLQWGRRR